MAQWEAPPIWEGGECWILGGGPSLPRQFGVPEEIISQVIAGRLGPDAYSPFMAPIHDKHVIAVNNSYMIGDWIDVVFFGDCNWYVQHKERLANFPGLKVTSCGRFANKPREMSQRIHYLGHDSIKGYGISNNPKKVAWNVNSGAAAISLARHFGVRKIILVGFDMSIDNRRNSHWHGAHGMGSKNGKKWIPPFPRHLKGFEYIAKDAQELGIEIINASPDSAIKELPKVAVSELLKESNHETQEAENNILVGGSNQEQGTMAISGDLLNRGNCNQAMQE